MSVKQTNPVQTNEVLQQNPKAVYIDVRTQQEFENGPWEIIGIYHSHPDHPSRPSQTDTDAAHEGYSYVIISVEKGKVAKAQSWLLNGAEKKFYEEEISE